MSKWWMSITLAAVGAFATISSAQQFPYMGGGQGGQGAMPEPMAISPAIPAGPVMPVPGFGGNPGMVPPDGGMQGYPGGPGMMPPGGPGMMPPGAMGPGVGFDPRQAPPGPQVDSRWYGGIGYLGLMRGRLDHSSLVQLDSTSGGVDTGNAYFGGPTVLDANKINPRLGNGFMAMVGKQWGEHAVEFGGFYISQQTSSKVVENKAGLNAPFSNPPIGFEGDNGMFLQGDVFKATIADQLGSFELNYRKWNCWCPYVSTTYGIRYLDVLERFNQYMGDDDLTVLNINGQPDRTRQATYYSTAHNRIVAPQLGIDFNYPLGMWLAIDLQAKGAWGANFMQTDIELQRGDGLIGRQGSQNQTVFSQLYEMGANMDVFITPHTRIRAGYNLLWVCDVGTATDQVNYDLAKATSGDHNGNIFFHGPSVQFQWAW